MPPKIGLTVRARGWLLSYIVLRQGRSESRVAEWRHKATARTRFLP